MSPDPSHWQERLTRRIGREDKPIVWLRGIAGTGKTRLVRSLPQPADKAPIRRFDGNSTSLDDALAPFRDDVAHPVETVLIASRPTVAMDQALLRLRLYGKVEVIGDHELFFTPEECGDAGLFAATGGWPVLVGAALDGRRDELNALLPDFLDQDVLPTLPHDLVTALFAAIEEPLPEGAVSYLFGDTATLHPLLRRSEEGVSIAGTDIHAALRRLGDRQNRWRRSTTDALIHIHSAYGNPAKAVKALNHMGQSRAALAVLEKAGGIFFGYRYGFPLMEEVLDCFPPSLSDQTDTLLLARVLVLLKTGRTNAALLRLETRYPGLPVDLRRMRYSHRPHAILFRLLVAADSSEMIPAAVIESWAQLDPLIGGHDPLAIGFLYAAMAVAFRRAGEPGLARRAAARGLSAFGQADAAYLAATLHLQLAGGALSRGELDTARDHLGRAGDLLAAAPQAFPGQDRLLTLHRAWLDYETGGAANILPELRSALNGLAGGDSHPDLHSDIARIGAIVAFRHDGLSAALDFVTACQFDLQRRHGGGADERMQIIRARLLQQAMRHGEAVALIDEAADDGSLPPDVAMDITLIRSREQTQRNVPSSALQELAQRADLSLRQRISIGVLQAFQRHRAGEASATRKLISSTLRLAAPEEALGVLLEEAEFLEKPLQHCLAENAFDDDPRLAAFAARLAARLRRLPATASLAKAVGGLSPQEHRVLLHLADGQSNKEIARALDLSESAIKFHLRNLFQKMNAKSRGELMAEARRRDIVR